MHAITSTLTQASGQTPARQERPLVSVILPAHNAGATLSASLRSLREQTLTDWEAIVIDDGSTDATLATARAIARTDPRITVLHQDNRGVSSARNAGLALARAEWVFFLDADDTIAPTHLDALLRAADRHRTADILYCDWRLVSADGTEGPRRRIDVTLDPAGIFADRCAITIHAALSRRAAILRVGGFDPALGVCEDWDLWQRLARTGAVFRRAPDTVAPYRITPGSATSGLARFLSAALATIRRGRTPDPRLTDLPLVAPLSLGSQTRAETAIAFWVAGRAIGAGEDPAAVLAAAQVLPDRTFDAPTAGDLLLDGILQGAGSARPDWPALWPRISARLAAFLDGVAPRIAMPAFAALTLRHAEAAVVAGLAAETRIGATTLLAFDIASPAADLDLPAGTERVVGLVQEQGTPLGRFCIAEDKRLAASRLAALTGEFSPAPAPQAAATPDDPLSGQYWETVFTSEDPWDYDNPYESLKYAQTLACIPGTPAAALELACAEGHFTRHLAARVGTLVASDISATAVERARSRCRGLGNVEFRVIDLLRDPLPGPMDLIVCSEVLYYLEDVDDLALAADRIASALAPGGHLVMTHGLLRGDMGAASGFDWGHRFGAASIAEVFSRARGLDLVGDHRSDMYRIVVFRRRDPAGIPAGVARSHLPVADTLPDDVTAHFDWAGRAPARFRRDAPGVPVLMYHRITDTPAPALSRYATAPAAFAQQMGWLAQNRYTPVTAEDFAASVWQGTPLPDRPVVITFDDGYRDNLVHAVPLLKSLGMAATIFIPVDHVGGSAAWDTLYGPPAPLMDWSELSQVREAGIGLSSHGCSHRPMPALSAAALQDEAQRSAALLGDRLGATARTLAYPYGLQDEATQRALLDAGYLAAFTTEDRRYRSGDRIMAVPRIEIRGDMSLEDFAARVDSF